MSQCNFLSEKYKTEPEAANLTQLSIFFKKLVYFESEMEKARKALFQLEFFDLDLAYLILLLRSDDFENPNQISLGAIWDIAHCRDFEVTEDDVAALLSLESSFLFYQE